MAQTAEQPNKDVSQTVDTTKQYAQPSKDVPQTVDTAKAPQPSRDVPQTVDATKQHPQLGKDVLQTVDTAKQHDYPLEVGPLADTLARLGTFLVSVVGLAYLVGWIASVAYFGAFNAQWVASMLTPSELLEKSQTVLFSLIGGTLSVMAGFADGTWGRKVDLSVEIGLSLAGTILIAIVVALEDSIRVTAVYGLVRVGAILVSLSVSFELGRFVFRTRHEPKKTSNAMWMLAGIWSTLIVFLPGAMGRAEGRVDVDPLRSALPVVRVDNQNWRLLLARPERFFLVRTEIGKPPIVKVVHVEKVDYVQGQGERGARAPARASAPVVNVVDAGPL